MHESFPNGGFFTRRWKTGIFHYNAYDYHTLYFVLLGFWNLQILIVNMHSSMHTSHWSTHVIP